MSHELIESLKPLKENMFKMAREDYTTATDFADYLVKEKKLTFRDAYKISSQLVNFAEKNNVNLDQVSINDLKKFYYNLDNSVLKIFNIKIKQTTMVKIYIYSRFAKIWHNFIASNYKLTFKRFWC